MILFLSKDIVIFCISVIDIDSVLRIDNKRAYPQAYLEQCKYKLKNIKNIIKDSDIDDAVDSHISFSVPDSYVKYNNGNSLNE